VQADPPQLARVQPMVAQAHGDAPVSQVWEFEHAVPLQSFVVQLVLLLWHMQVAVSQVRPDAAQVELQVVTSHDVMLQRPLLHEYPWP
jgi:hypothetical protein